MGILKQFSSDCLSIFRAKKGKKGKRSSKKKKGRRGGKKSKKKKEKDLTPDRTLESLYEELITNGPCCIYFT